MKLNKTFYLFLLLVCIVNQVQSETSVWKITKNEQKFYLGGTIHVLSTADYPLPEEFDKAFEKSDIIVFETDIQKMGDAMVQKRMMAALTYPEGETLQQDLSPETYTLLESYFAEKGIPLASFNGFKASMITMTITMMELQKLGIGAQGVDFYFFQKAVEEEKTLGQLETIDQQIDFLANMGAGREDQLILSTLKDMEELPQIMKEMVEYWRKGDTAMLEELIIKDLKEEFPQIYQDLMVERNNHWMIQIEEMAATEAVEFILVGDAHMVGEDGLLAQLESRGYTVEQY